MNEITMSLFDESREPYPLPSAEFSLGMQFDPQSRGATFRLWAPEASEVALNLYSFGEQAPRETLPMILDSSTGVWSSRGVVADCEGLSYDYLVTRGTHRVHCLDPYASAMEPTRIGSGRSIISSGRGVVYNPEGFASPVPPAGHSVTPSDAVIYEVHVRDFTIGLEGLAAKPGTFAAFRERIPYLQELGVTHVQLLPVFKAAFLDELKQDFEHTGRTHDNNYNWCYDPQNYFSINGWLSSNPNDPLAPIRELRELVAALHEAGILVILDVVYNHMADTRFLEDIVPEYFFRREIDGRYSSNSGCGNDIASSRFMARKLIIESLQSAASTFGVDGFRFDLMGLIDSETILQAKSRVECRTGRNDLLFLGEGWRMYNGPGGTVAMDQDYMMHTDEVAVFSDEIRDLLKAGGMEEEGTGFITNRQIDLELLYHNLLGDPRQYFRALGPFNIVNYIAAHDGLTLHDALAHNAGLDPHTPEQREELRRRILLGNFLLLTSQGIIFLHAGQERGRSKHVPSHQYKCIGTYVRDSYNSDDMVNAFPWKADSWQTGLMAYTQGLIRLRTAESAFRMGDTGEIERRSQRIPADSAMAIGYALRADDACVLLVLANAGREPVSFDIPSEVLGIPAEHTEKRVLADSQRVDARGIQQPQNMLLAASAVTLDPLSWALVQLQR